MKTIDTLIQDINDYLESPNGMSKEACDILAKRLSKTMYDKFNARRDTKFRLRPSNLGTCQRKLWYQNKPEIKAKHGGSYSGQDLQKFLFGDIIETIELTLAELAGHKVEHCQGKVSGFGITGSIDAIIDGVLVDLKSASPYSFKSKFKQGGVNNGDDPFGYIDQLSFYKVNETVVTEGDPRFMAVNKVDSDKCLVPAKTKTKLEVGAHIDGLRAMLAKDTEPEARPEPQTNNSNGNLEIAKTCSWCAFKEHCYRDANNGEGIKGYEYSQGKTEPKKVKWLCHIDKEPRVSQAPCQEDFDIPIGFGTKSS